ncbi:MAG: hypothetical protein WCU88_11325 [Elusimicrobiota bacterium]|jgi:hypothetical protein
MREKVEELLASLRGGPAPAAAAQASVSAVPMEEVLHLREKVAELEARLGEPPAPPAAQPAVQEVLPEDGGPAAPRPPSEMALYMHTKVELLEKRLEQAQQEAIRSGEALREREEVHHKARREVEGFFKTLREQQHSEAFDRQLREQFLRMQKHAQDLEARLSEAQLRMLPAEEILSWLEKENGSEELKKRVQDRLSGASAPPVPPAASVPPCPPPMQHPFLMQSPARHEQDLNQFSGILGRLADLETRLEDADKERAAQTQKRLAWESGVLEAFKQSAGRWFRAGGPELLVESALETLVDTLQKREELTRGMDETLKLLRQEPPDSPQSGALRQRLAQQRRMIDQLQEDIDKRLAVVNAWVDRSRGERP